MKKWYFPSGKDLQKEGVNKANLETFKSNVLGSLVREIGQNSLDAKRVDDKNNDPVKIEFQLKSVSTKHDFLDLKTLKDKMIPLAKKTWSGKEERIHLKSLETILNKDSINVLRISDYNTTGLEEDNWEALINNIGSSVKDSIDSGGSFGIGKHAPFATSEYIRMVFYNTLLSNGEEKSIGVIQFLSVDKENGETTQGIGYLGMNKKEPFNKMVDFGFKLREEPGTDVFVIGFNYKNWEDAILFYALDNFLVSIYNEKLIFTIEDRTISRSNISNSLQVLENQIKENHSRRFLNELDVIRNYYDVLTNPTDVFYLSKEFINKHKHYNGEDYLEEDACLKIRTTIDKSNRKILLTRDAGMKIKEQTGFIKGIQFNGIFMATGKKINERLKNMENPEHNDWIPGRNIKDQEKKDLIDELDEEFLSDLRSFFRESVRETFENNISHTIDAYLLDMFLTPPITDNDEKEKEREVLNNDIKPGDVLSKTDDKDLKIDEYIEVNGVFKKVGDLGKDIAADLENYERTYLKKEEGVQSKILKTNKENEYILMLDSTKDLIKNKIYAVEIELVTEVGMRHDSLNIIDAYSDHGKLKRSNNTIFFYPKDIKVKLDDIKNKNKSYIYFTAKKSYNYSFMMKLLRSVDVDDLGGEDNEV